MTYFRRIEVVRYANYLSLTKNSRRTAESNPSPLKANFYKANALPLSQLAPTFFTFISHQKFCLAAEYLVFQARAIESSFEASWGQCHVTIAVTSIFRHKFLIPNFSMKKNRAL